MTVVMEKETDDTENERQEEEGIVRLVVLQAVRHHALVAVEEAVYERYTGNGIAVPRVAEALRIVLAAHEVPAEVTQVHEAYLVTDKEADVITKGRRLAVPQAQMRFIEIGVALVVAGVPHAGEQHHVFGIVNRYLFFADYNVFFVAAGVDVPFLLIFFGARGEHLAVDQREVAILLTAEVT